MSGGNRAHRKGGARARYGVAKKYITRRVGREKKKKIKLSPELIFSKTWDWRLDPVDRIIQ